MNARRSIRILLVAVLAAAVAAGCYNFRAKQRQIDENERTVGNTAEEIRREQERRKALEEALGKEPK